VETVEKGVVWCCCLVGHVVQHVAAQHGLGAEQVVERKPGVVGVVVVGPGDEELGVGDARGVLDHAVAQDRAHLVRVAVVVVVGVGDRVGRRVVLAGAGDERRVDAESVRRVG